MFTDQGGGCQRLGWLWQFLERKQQWWKNSMEISQTEIEIP